MSTTTPDSGILRRTVNDVIAERPATVAVFHRHGIDACCGGDLPVGEAAERHGIDPSELLAELEEIEGEG